MTDTPDYTYRWAEAVASTGAGDDALIEIDITAPNVVEPVPVVVPLKRARELHAMLGGVLAEHDPATEGRSARRGPCLCGRRPDPGICPGTCTTSLPRGGHCRCACGTDQAREQLAEAPSWTAVNDARRGEAEAVRARKAAEQQAAESRTYAERADREGERLAELLGQTEAVVKHTKELMTRRTETLRTRAEQAETTAARYRDAWVNARGRARYWHNVATALTNPQPATDPCAHGCRQAADEHTRLSQELDAEPQRCCVCGTDNAPCENYRGQRFCGLCAECECGDNPCERTGINDPTVSSEAADREQPAEPLLRGTPEVHVHVSVTPAQVTDAVRRIFREDRVRPQDLLR